MDAAHHHSMQQTSRVLLCVCTWTLSPQFPYAHQLSLLYFLLYFSLTYFCLLHLPLLLNQWTWSRCVMPCSVDLCYRDPSLFTSSAVVLAVRRQPLSSFHPGPASTACWRLALWVGGSCMRGTLWAACCWLFSPLNLCSFSPHSLHFPFFFLLLFCGGGKNLRCGLFVLVWCRFSHVLGRLSYLHDSSLDCEGLSWYRVRFVRPPICPRWCRLRRCFASLAQKKANVHAFIVAVTYSLSPLMLEPQSAVNASAFPCHSALVLASRDSSFPSPHLMRLSVLFMFLLGEWGRPSWREREACNSTGDLREINEGV